MQCLGGDLFFRAVEPSHTNKETASQEKNSMHEEEED